MRDKARFCPLKIVPQTIISILLELYFVLYDISVSEHLVIYLLLHFSLLQILQFLSYSVFKHLSPLDY